MNKDRRQLLIFGYWFSLLFGFFAVRAYFKSGWPMPAAWLAGISFTFLVVTSLKTQWLKPLKHGMHGLWLKLVQLFSILSLSLVFYLIFSIIGLVLRLLRKDLLKQQWDQRLSSYWIDRPAQDENPDRYLKQF